MQHHITRRNFIRTTTALSGGLLLPGSFFSKKEPGKNTVPVYAHLWVYASRFPPDWDCTPIMNQVFNELKTAGLQGVEVMEVHLRQKGAVERFKALIQQHALPVTGTSYYGDMWNKAEHTRILEDLDMVTERLQAIGATMMGITVGDARRIKTEEELDHQAVLLKQAMRICARRNIEPNLHNHTFEVDNGMYDLKGTIARVPEIKLGPDLNWLVRAGVDPVSFIKNYGDKMVYLHLRDQGADGKWTEAVGEGVMDFTAIARALKEINYNGKAAIELAFDNPPTRPVQESWEKSRNYVRKVFGW